MTEKKRYLIDIFLRVSKQMDSLEKKIKNICDILGGTFSDIDKEKIKKTFDRKYILDKVTPVINTHFTAEELQKIIDFFSTQAGKKLVDSVYEEQCDFIIKKLFNEIELTFVQSRKST
jgi:hemerythrin